MGGSGAETKSRTETHAPEGGFGYIVAVGMALPFYCALNTVPSFGLMFNDFLTSLGQKTSAVTIITSCFFTAVSFAGLFTNTLFQKFSIRSVGLFGAILYTLGSFMVVFVTSVEQLMIAYSIFQGVGFGFMIPVAYTTFNSYFVEKRVTMMSLTQTLIGLGNFVYPLLIDFLMTKYGFRATMAIVAAMNSNVIVGMLVMHPVEWHSKVKIIPLEEEIKSLVDENGNAMKQNEENEVKIVVTEEALEMTEIPDVEEKNHLNVPTDELLRRVVMSETISIKRERSKSLDVMGIEEFNPSRRVSSISSLGNWTGAVVVSDATPQKNGKWKKVVDFLDLTLLKDLIYVNIALGISFALHSDSSFFALQPMYLYELGFSKPETARIVAIGSGADLISRMLLAALSVCIHTSARNVYWAGAFFTVIFRFVFLGVSDFYGMAIITAILGFLKTWVHVPLPLVFAEYLSHESRRLKPTIKNLNGGGSAGRKCVGGGLNGGWTSAALKPASGYGLFMFIQGNISLLIGPFIGWIRDSTHSYVICFHSLTFFMGLCAFPWIIEYILIRIKNKKADRIHASL